MLNSAVLVLNRSYIPIHVTSARDAFTLMYRGIARAVDENYKTFDFQDWSQLAAAVHEEKIGLVNRFIRIPRVVLLQTYDKIPNKNVRFNRHNIYLRDKCTCQYCGRRFPKTELNLDHVVPKSRGGRTSWENVVCSCLRCNRLKGGKTPEEAGIKLLTHPKKPRWSPLFGASISSIKYKEWLPFLNITDFSYWHLELKRG